MSCWISPSIFGAIAFTLLHTSEVAPQPETTHSLLSKGVMLARGSPDTKALVKQGIVFPLGICVEFTTHPESTAGGVPKELSSFYRKILAGVCGRTEMDFSQKEAASEERIDVSRNNFAPTIVPV